jgi:hypothetical protein
MTLNIIVYVPNGIVMASDSRLTLTDRYEENKEIIEIKIPYINSCFKTVLIPNHNIGLSMRGKLLSNGRGIVGYLDNFFKDQLQGSYEVQEIAKLLLEYFENFNDNLDVYFFLAGYKNQGHKKIQVIYEVMV